MYLFGHIWIDRDKKMLKYGGDWVLMKPLVVCPCWFEIQQWKLRIRIISHVAIASVTVDDQEFCSNLFLNWAMNFEDLSGDRVQDPQLSMFSDQL